MGTGPQEKNNASDQHNLIAGTSISVATFAILVERSPEWVRLRINDGTLERGKDRGTVRLGGAVTGYIKYVKKLLAEANRTNPARDRLQTAKASQIERRLAREATSLISFDEASDALGVVADLATQEFEKMRQGMPPSVAPAFDKIAEQTAARLTKARDDLRAHLRAGTLGEFVYMRGSKVP